MLMASLDGVPMDTHVSIQSDAPIENPLSFS